jgi:hypothetical protein
LRKVIGKPFCKQDIRLDGYQYSDCTFQACRFVYSTKGKFVLVGNSVSADCRFEFRGKAAEMIEALSDLYALGDWGKQCVTAAFQQITADLENRTPR